MQHSKKTKQTAIIAGVLVWVGVLLLSLFAPSRVNSIQEERVVYDNFWCPMLWSWFATVETVDAITQDLAKLVVRMDCYRNHELDYEIQIEFVEKKLTSVQVALGHMQQMLDAGTDMLNNKAGKKTMPVTTGEVISKDVESPRREWDQEAVEAQQLIPVKKNDTPKITQTSSLAGLLWDGVQVIGCINSKTLEVRKPLAKVGMECYHGQNRQNIKVPPLSHLPYFQKYWHTDRAVINRFPIINFESSFNENAKGKWDWWYVQTRIHYNVPRDIDSQLWWMARREKENTLKVYLNGSKRCGYFRENPNTFDGFPAGEEWVLACMYRYHNHARYGSSYA